jgi:virulence-associated protein VapD
MFELVLTNDIEDLSLVFKLKNTEIANKWFDELSKKYELYEIDRFSNWANNDFINQLNKQIDIINEYDNIIDKKVSTSTKQKDLNYLHKFFEDLRGEATVGTKWFKNAPDNVKTALEKFNILIHQLESEIRTKNKHPTLVVTFKESPRLELSQDDIKHFTYKWESGTVYINYCHVGKTVLDAFTDKDNITEAIRPQTHYSADFIIKFGPSTNPIVYFLRSIIINIWLKFKNFKLKNLNIGLIPVATIITKIDKDTLLKFNKVKTVKCLK